MRLVLLNIVAVVSLSGCYINCPAPQQQGPRHFNAQTMDALDNRYVTRAELSNSGPGLAPQFGMGVTSNMPKLYPKTNRPTLIGNPSPETDLPSTKAAFDTVLYTMQQVDRVEEAVIHRSETRRRLQLSSLSNEATEDRPPPVMFPDGHQISLLTPPPRLFDQQKQKVELISDQARRRGIRTVGVWDWTDKPDFSIKCLYHIFPGRDSGEGYFWYIPVSN